MILDATSKSVEIKLGEAISTVQPEWVMEAVEIDSATGKLLALVTGDGVTNGVTAVVVLSAPAAAKARQLKQLTVYNADSIAHTVIPQLHSGANIRRWPKQSLLPGESFLYVG